MKIQKFFSKNIILIALLLCISASQSIAQSSNGIFFQAVARDNFSNPAKDRNIYVESSILQTTVNGTKVLVEFGSGKAEGLVVGRKDKSDQTQKLKPILDLTSPSGMVSETVISHIEMVRNRFGGSFWAVLNSAVPSRVVKEEKIIETDASINESGSYDSPELRELIGRADFGQLLSKQKLKWGINFPIATDPNWFLLEIVKLLGGKFETKKVSDICNDCCLSLSKTI